MRRTVSTESPARRATSSAETAGGESRRARSKVARRWPRWRSSSEWARRGINNNTSIDMGWPERYPPARCATRSWTAGGGERLSSKGMRTQGPPTAKRPIEATWRWCRCGPARLSTSSTILSPPPTWSSVWLPRRRKRWSSLGERRGYDRHPHEAGRQSNAAGPARRRRVTSTESLGVQPEGRHDPAT